MKFFSSSDRNHESAVLNSSSSSSSTTCCITILFLISLSLPNVDGFLLPISQQQGKRSIIKSFPRTPFVSIKKDTITAATTHLGGVDNDDDNMLSTPNEDSSSSLPSSDGLVFNSIWEELATNFVSDDYVTDPAELREYVQAVTLLRVGVPSILAGGFAGFCYPAVSLFVAAIINDSAAFEVIANDYSQYIQNILTTCGLTFSILVGQTYYFMYQQQEAVYLSLFEEVTVAKSLLEQVALVCQGRTAMYDNILECIDQYVQNDLLQINEDPAKLLSARPIDDPFERIMFLTSVGEPSVVYQTVRSLRQARAYRLGALQRKLPAIHMILLWSLAGIVLCTFPVLGAGVQTLGGLNILKVQSWYLSFIVFGIVMTLGVINELRQPAGKGAYNVVSVLSVMVGGLEEELKARRSGQYKGRGQQFLAPTVDILPSSFTTDIDMAAGGSSYWSTTNSNKSNDETVLSSLSLSSSPALAVAEETITNDSMSSTTSSTGNDTTTGDSGDEQEKKVWFGKRIARRIRNKK